MTRQLTALRDDTRLFWLLLALPAIPMVWPVIVNGAEYRAVLGPSGTFGAQLLVLALAISPLREIFPDFRAVSWLAARRRSIGVAAFGYALLHLVFFAAAIGRLDYILQGLAFTSMWTGWLAFALMLALAVTSNRFASQALGRAWKMLHRIAYLAAILVLAHWVLLTSRAGEALLWFVPLALLQLARIGRHMSRRRDNAMARRSRR